MDSAPALQCNGYGFKWQAGYLDKGSILEGEAQYVNELGECRLEMKIFLFSMKFINQKLPKVTYLICY